MPVDLILSSLRCNRAKVLPKVGYSASPSVSTSTHTVFSAVGHIPGSTPRPDLLDIAKLSASIGSDVNEYAPTTGVKELREAVAHLYNDTYRKGKESQL
jgi:hypothetical protein